MAASFRALILLPFNDFRVVIEKDVANALVEITVRGKSDTAECNLLEDYQNHSGPLQPQVLNQKDTDENE